MTTGRPTLQRALPILLALGLLGAAAALWSAPLGEAPVTHEGQAYVEGAARIGHWLRGEAIQGQRTGARAAWSLHDHHAPLVKLVHGAAWATLSGSRGGFGAVEAGGLAAALLALALTVLVGWRAMGAAGGLAAGALLVGMPRFAAGAVTASAEPIIALAWTLLALTFAPSVDRRRWAIPAAVAFACAFAADSQGVFLLIPLLVYTHLALPARGVGAADAPASPPVGQGTEGPAAGGLVPMGAWPPHILLVLAAGPALALAAWPLARGGDLGKRLVTTLLDPLKATPEPFLHAGIRWDGATGPEAPFGATLSWLVERLPVVVVVLGAVGALLLARDTMRWRRRPDGPAPRTMELALPALLTLTVVVLCGVNGTPTYAKGIDRLLPVAPFAALLAALGLVSLGNAAAAWMAPRWRPALLAGAVLLAAGPGWVQTAGAGPYGGLWVGALGGGTAGAAAGGEQLAAGAFVPRELARWLDTLPANASIAVLPRRDQVERILRRMAAEGELHRTPRFAGPETADHLILLWAPEAPEWPVAAAALRGQPPELVFEALGVRVATIFAIR